SLRAFTASGSHRDSERKNCSRCTAGCCAPVTGSAPASAVSVLFRSRGYPDFHQDCALPASTTILQAIEFPKNKPDSSVHNTVTVTLPSSNPFARMLAGQASSRKDRLRALQCLFGTV